MKHRILVAFCILLSLNISSTHAVELATSQPRLTTHELGVAEQLVERNQATRASLANQCADKNNSNQGYCNELYQKQIAELAAYGDLHRRNSESVNTRVDKLRVGGVLVEDSASTQLVRVPRQVRRKLRAIQTQIDAELPVIRSSNLESPLVRKGE